jgi:parvulin-like peptidyl-prolyl isomerase
MAEQVRASHILVDSKEKAENIKQEIENGKDFGKLAKEASEGPSSENEGDLGFFGKGDMVKPFEREVFSMDVGEVSGPVKTEFGYHLIKKTGEK